MKSLRFLRHFSTNIKQFYDKINKEIGVLCLKDVLSEKILELRNAVKEFRKYRGHEIISNVTLNDLYGGLRGCRLIVCETSSLDPYEGVRFRDLTIPEVQKLLPKAEDCTQPLPEGLFWLMLTGEIPTRMQAKTLSLELANRAKIPQFVIEMIKNFPKTVHPLTQLSCAVGALHFDSIFSEKYSQGIPEDREWESFYEDALDLIAKIPVVAACIYKNCVDDSKTVDVDLDMDWAGNFTQLLGFSNRNFMELMRLYMTIHADHEGGNVAAHTSYLVASASADPYK